MYIELLAVGWLPQMTDLSNLVLLRVVYVCEWVRLCTVLCEKMGGGRDDFPNSNIRLSCANVVD